MGLEVCFVFLFSFLEVFIFKGFLFEVDFFRSFGNLMEREELVGSLVWVIVGGDEKGVV